ncbi:MAG: Oligopeptide transport ATP-binding protein OppD [Paracidovorax wautersii]|uniref:Oligopeptide transport ATP-binding protein OppD n=1 Tax=Paracidovorax wautersii TaxID=1177982 RepID=A0A7V8FRV7_9BURK|nr:MAG: Oligopeptide transport ATP-binding protein OppD [Paracidovorax wautersii]
MTVLLETRDLRTQLATRGGLVTAVDGVSLQVRSGQALALVGESGSGKSMTCASLLGLLPANGRVVGGQVLFHGQDLLRLPPRELRAIRGRRIGMVLQDAMGALNPLMTVGDQLAGVLRWHQGIRDRAELRRRSVAALEAVRIPAAAQRLASFPFQFSGGMRQRVCLAIALACEPEVLLCDEPTTALDVTVQLQILRLLRDLQRSRGLSVVFVTHDLTLAAQFCDDVAIMYAGRVVEQGPTAEVFRRPLHPYTQGLLAAAPRLAAEPQRLATIPGTPPSALDWPAGCRFAPRCAWADAQCHAAYPDALAWSTEAGERRAACWRVPQRLADEPDWRAAA